MLPSTLQPLMIADASRSPPRPAPGETPGAWNVSFLRENQNTMKRLLFSGLVATGLLLTPVMAEDQPEKAVKDAGRATKKTAKTAADKTEDAGEAAVDHTKSGAKKAGRAVKKSAKTAADKTEDAGEVAVDKTKSGAKKTKRAVQDAVK